MTTELTKCRISFMARYNAYGRLGDRFCHQLEYTSNRSRLKVRTKFNKPNMAPPHGQSFWVKTTIISNIQIIPPTTQVKTRK